MITEIKFELSYTGNEADRHELDFYDAAEALIGFQRSLALTTHLILNGEIIVQAPSLKGAKIMVTPSEVGSWTIAALIVGTAGVLYKVATAPKDTPLGNIISSAYDCLINESLGFHVDYDKTLGQQAEELGHYEQKQRIEPPSLIIPTELQKDSLAEKCETAITQMHRPIVGKATASSGRVIYQYKGGKKYTQPLNMGTYDYIKATIESESVTSDIGRVSSYNMNTFKGRVYSRRERRPIPFELAENSRDRLTIDIITGNLHVNTQDRLSQNGYIAFKARRFESRAGMLKKILITEVRHATIKDITLRQS